MISTKGMRVKKRLLIPILLALFLLVGISMYWVHTVMFHHIDITISQHTAGVEKGLADHIQTNIQAMIVTLDLLARNKELQQAWLAGDREALSENARPLFGSMRGLGVYNFFFVRPDKSVFLRLPDQDRYGDIVDSFLMNRSAQTGLPSAGVSTCVIGKVPVLQAVMPWRVDDKVTGFIGINIEITQIAQILSEEFTVDLIVSMVRENGADTDIPQGAPVPWPEQSPLTPIFSSLNPIPASAADAIHHFLTTSAQPSVDIVIGEQKYRATSFHLADAAGKKIAKVALLDNITKVSSHLHMLSQILVTLVVVGGGIFGYFFLYLGKIDKELIRSRSALLEALQCHKATADELQVLKDNLEQRVAEQTRALTASNDELSNKIVEAEVARKEAKYAYTELEQIFEANTSGMRVIDHKQNVIRANKSFARLVGLSWDEVLTRKCSEHFSCPNSDTPRCCRNQIFAGKEYVESEEEITCNDGTRLWVFHTAAPYRDNQGEIVGVVQSFQDITNRKKAELSVLKAYEQWENTFNAMGDIVTIHDRDMRIVRANKAAATTLQLPVEQLIGKYCFAVFRGADLPCEGCPEARAMHDYELHTAEIEHRHLKKTFLVSAAPLIDEHGVCTGAVHVAKDITELKTLEAHLSQAQKMEAIGTLAGGIAHDFNNILGVIFGYANFAQESLGKESSEYDDIEQVLNAAHRAKDLVTQILAFSRQDKTEKILLAPALIVKDLLKFLRSTLPAFIEIRQNIVVGQTRILADPTQVYQVLMNLCINASHAMEQEGGVLDIELAEQMIDAVTHPEHPTLPPGKYLALRVSDTGHGIAPEMKERIFEPFFTTKEKGKGTGMGLAVAHGIVQEHGGDITVHSRPGEGTTFLVLFPVAEHGEDKPVSPDEASTPGGDEKILVVDDEEDLAHLLGRILKSFGYEVVIATSSSEALAIFQVRPDFFDLVITDQTMPLMKGTALAHQLLQLRPGLPIILCTGYSEEIHEGNAKAQGIHTVLGKPVIKSTLAGAIRNALDAVKPS